MSRHAQEALLAVYLCVFLAALLVWLRRDRRLANIPGPGGLLPTGQLFGLPPDATTLFREWAHTYGEVFKVRVGWRTWVVVNSPQAIKEIFDRQSSATSSKVPAPIGDGIVAGGRRMINMPYGPRWRAYRSCVHQVLSPKMTRALVPAQQFEIKQLLCELAEDNAGGGEFYRHVQRMSLSIVMTATYGRRIASWDNEDAQWALRSSSVLGKISRPGTFVEDDIPLLARLPPALQPSRRRAEGYSKPVNGAKMRLWNILKAQVSGGSAPTCFASSLMASGLRQFHLEDEDAAWITGGFVEAGSETTSVTLNNLILHFAAYPSVQARAHGEIDGVVPCSRLPAYEDIDRLPYIRASVKEILRLRPVPVWGMKHYTDAEVTYKSFVIPRGCVVLGNTAALHFDEGRFPQPHTFAPHRHLDPVTGAETAGERGHFSFGAGRRICPGSKMAENTLHLALASILWAFEIRPQGAAAAMDVSEGAFEDTAFRGPKPFTARFVARDEQRLGVLKRAWCRAREDGYELDGRRVTEEGVVG